MKQILTLTFILISNYVFCQTGLEGIIVEKYYIADQNDALNEDGGKLIEGSTTYRIYVDLKPGWVFQTAYGVPEHELLIETTTKFFNNEDRGAKFPIYSKSQARSNTVMLDSWLTVGGACAGNIGVLKEEDNGLETVVNKDGILLNNNSEAGIPISQEDGMIAGPVEPVTILGIDNEIQLFDNTNDLPAPHIFKTSNGAWAALNGAKGQDSLKNKVLIAQLTTDGVLSFKLNIQIRNNIDLTVERYVADNPLIGEFTHPELTFASNMTSVEEVDLSKNYTFIYPNPTNDKTYFAERLLYLNLPFSLYDNTGKIIMSGLTSESGIDMSELSNGLYFLSILENNNTQVIKLIKN